MVVATKRIKTKWMFADKVQEFGTSSEPTVEETFMWQDNVTIVGWSFHVWHDTPATPAYTEGDLESAGYFSQVGSYRKDGELASMNSKQEFWTEIVVAQQTAGLSGSPVTTNDTVIFPEGYGIDMDEGSYLYLLLGGNAFGLSAGNLSIKCSVHIFYVER